MPDSTATQFYSLMIGNGLALLTMIGCVAMLLAGSSSYRRSFAALETWTDGFMVRP